MDGGKRTDPKTTSLTASMPWFRDREGSSTGTSSLIATACSAAAIKAGRDERSGGQDSNTATERERRKRALSTEHRMVSGERAGEGCVRARRGAGGAGEGGFMRRARQTLQPDVARGRQPMETRTGPMGSRAKWRAVRALEMNHEAQATRWRKAWRAGLHFRRDPLI